MQETITPEEVFDFYSRIFLPAYARAIAELQDKPTQITVEIENAFSHMAVYFSCLKNGNIRKQNEHLKKAKGHLERATLDAYKFTWIALCKKSRIFDGKGVLEHATKISLEKAVELQEDFKKAAKAARIQELSSLEEAPEKRNEFYKNAIDIADQLYDSLDMHKLRKFKSFSVAYHVKINFVTYLLGVLTGVAGNFVTDWIKSK